MEKLTITDFVVRVLKETFYGIAFYSAKLWMLTWKIEWKGLPSSEKSIIALWHGDLPILICAFRKKGVGVLISESADGHWAAKLCNQWGYHVFRGSSTKNGAKGMRALARFLKNGGDFGGMALDGPRGPRFKVQPGTLWLSQITGFSVLHPTVQATHALRLKTWDRTLIPLPFSKIRIELHANIPEGESGKPNELKLVTK